MATLKEIAAEAGVSMMTISNVINNNHARVSPATEEKVRRILEKHQYVPNMAARTLSSRSSRIIALLLPIWHEDAASMLLDPYAGQMVGYLEELLRAKEYYVMVFSFRDVEQVLTIRRTWQMDGMILIMPHEDGITRRLILESECPLVVLDRYYEDLKMLSVVIDDRKGGYLATRHLLENGHRDIGYIGPDLNGSSVIHDRFLGYMDALHEYGIRENSSWFFDHAFHQEGGERAAQELLHMIHRPSAMVASEDLIACGLVRGFQAAGKEVPESLSVIGFDDSLPARLISPGLTTVGQDIRAKAELAAEELFHAIKDPSYRDHRSVLEISLTVRQSVSSR